MLAWSCETVTVTRTINVSEDDGVTSQAHMTQMNHWHISQQALYWEIPGFSRAPSQQRTSWKGTVKADSESVGLTWKQAETVTLDRQEWIGVWPNVSTWKQLNKGQGQRNDVSANVWDSWKYRDRSLPAAHFTSYMTMTLYSACKILNLSHIQSPHENMFHKSFIPAQQYIATNSELWHCCHFSWAGWANITAR